MKMKSCVHWNYGYYGPKKGCMIGKECKCEDYERRSIAKRRAATSRKIMADKRAAQNAAGKPIGMSKGFVTSKHCRHELIERVDTVKIHYCACGSSIKNLPEGCPKGCPYQEPPVGNR